MKGDVMTHNLKPCPFCGESENLYLVKTTMGYEVKCHHCQATVPGTSMLLAVKDWNKRAK